MPTLRAKIARETDQLAFDCLCSKTRRAKIWNLVMHHAQYLRIGGHALFTHPFTRANFEGREGITTYSTSHGPLWVAAVRKSKNLDVGDAACTIRAYLVCKLHLFIPLYVPTLRIERT